MNDLGKICTDKLKIRQPTCPWWFLFTFDNPIRKFYQDPEKILTPYLNQGDLAVDLGCGMGYFSVPMAKLVGETGKVICVDLQAEMLQGLKKRAQRAGLAERIDLHHCTQEQIGVTGPVDFVVAFWMAHEVHHRKEFFDQIYKMLKTGGSLLIAEPYLHVSRRSFQQMRAELLECGFSILDNPGIGFSRSILVQKEKGARSWK